MYFSTGPITVPLLNVIPPPMQEELNNFDCAYAYAHSPEISKLTDAAEESLERRHFSRSFLRDKVLRLFDSRWNVFLQE